ncbi:hypothetical protein Tco_1437556 [Tanacetum coccineum]
MNHSQWGGQREGESLKMETEGPINLGPERTRVYSDCHKRKGREGDCSEKYRVTNTEDKGNSARGAVEQSKQHSSTKRPQNSEILQRQDVADASSKEGVILDEEQSLFLAGGLDNAIDEDVDEPTVSTTSSQFGLMLFQADDVIV